ncbi:unnamed protein product, partial [marine sediment metagenome]
NVFGESAAGMRALLEQQGVRVSEAEEATDDSLHILFGAHTMAKLPQRYVLYQGEQLKSSYFTHSYREKIKGAVHVFDHSRKGQELCSSLGCESTQVSFPVSVDVSCVPPDPEQRYDLLFYGCGNARRSSLKESFRRSDLTSKFFLGFDLFGERRDREISSAAVVLNVHFYAEASLEVHRINYLLARGKVVLSEPSSDTEMDALYSSVVHFAPMSGLALKAREIVGRMVTNPNYESDRAKKAREFIHERMRVTSLKIAKVIRALLDERPTLLALV